MRKQSDYGGGDLNNPYCFFCTDKSGKLLPREEVQEKLVKIFMKQGVCREEAERKAVEVMSSAPAWKK